MASTSTSANEESGKQILERRITIGDAEEAADYCLVTSLTEKLQVEYRLMSRKCCIFKVPARLREINEKAFIPQSVSIGPFHRNNLKQFKAMENYKVHYLKEFLRRRPSITLKDCVEMLKRLEEEARGCYADDINLTSDEFVEMMMLDGCFIVEYFLRHWKPELREQYEPLFHNLYFQNICQQDLLLLENQLPFFVLDALLNLINSPEKIWEISFLELALKFYECEDLCTLHEPTHLLDSILQTYIPSKRTDKKGHVQKSCFTIPSATQLWEAGVKLRAAPDERHLLDMRFENGILEIPTILFHDETEHLFRNLIAYEQCYSHSTYMADYLTLIDDLVNSPSDVALLKRKGIIINWLGDSKEVSNMVNKIVKNVYMSEDFHFSDLYDKLKHYYGTPWRK